MRVVLLVLLALGVAAGGCAHDDGMGGLWKGVKHVQEQRK